MDPMNTNQIYSPRGTLRKDISPTVRSPLYGGTRERGPPVGGVRVMPHQIYPSSTGSTSPEPNYQQPPTKEQAWRGSEQPSTRPKTPEVSGIPTTDLPLSTEMLANIKIGAPSLSQAERSNSMPQLSGYILPFGPDGPRSKATTLKEGYLFKKGKHFFTSWKTKWAVLSQELPNGVLLPNGNTVNQPEDLQVHLIAPSKPAVLSLYDDRRHAEARIPPKHSITLHDSASIEEIEYRFSNRHSWTVKTDERKVLFSTSSGIDKSEWIRVLNKVRNMHWYKNQPAFKQNSQNQSPSAPNKEDIPSDGLQDQKSRQPSVTLSLQIPSQATPRDPNNKELYWDDQLAIFREEEIEDILSGKNVAISPSQETIARWKQEKWSDLYYLYQRWHMDQYNVSYLKFMERLSDFRAAATFYARKLVDEIHTRPVTGERRMDRVRIGEITIKFAAEYRLDVDIQAQEKKLEHQIKGGQALHHIASPLFSRLVWLIDYKGFRLEAIVSLPTNQSSGSSVLSYHMSQDRHIDRGTLYTCDPVCSELLGNIGHALHLQPYDLSISNHHATIGCSRHIKVYRDPHEQRYYAHNLDHLLPCDGLRMDETYPGSLQEGPILSKRSSGVNDYDDDSAPDTLSYLQQYKIRSELLQMLSFSIPADPVDRISPSGSGEYMDPLQDEETNTWIRACTIIRDQQCSLLARKLDRLDTIPWSSDILTEFFHVHGVNMRYLGIVESKATLPHSKEACMIDMIARSFKHIYRSRLRQAIFHYQQMGATKIQSELFSLTADLYAELFKYQKSTLNPQALAATPTGLFVHGPLLQAMQSKFGYSESIPTYHPVRNVHPYALFEALNYHCSVVWDEAYHQPQNGRSELPTSTIDYARLSGDAILSLGSRDRGVVITQPPVYPFLRLNEYRGTAGLGLLMNCSTEEDLGILGSDLHFHSSYNRQKELSHCTSPTNNYFTICSMPLNTFDISAHQNQTTANAGPYHPACSLAAFTPPPITYVAAIHFQSMGALRSSPNPRSALWFYLLAHDALFRQASTKKALWLAKVGLKLNRFNAAINTGNDSVGIIGGVLNAQLRLLAAQALMVEMHQKEQEDVQIRGKIESWIDLAHRELLISIGSNHPLLMRFYQMLAGTFWFVRQCEKSVEYQRKAVEMSLRGLGKVHAWTLRALLLLGSFCLHIGDMDQALHTFRECLQGSMQGKDIGSCTAINDPIFLAEVHYALSEAYLIYGDLDLALQHALNSQQMKEGILGTDHPFTIHAYYQVAEMALSSCQSVMGMLNQEPTGNDGSLAAAHSYLWDMNKIITKTKSKNAHIALQCYEKIFQFVKYQAATKTGTVKGGNKSGTMAGNAVRAALYAPMAKVMQGGSKTLQPASKSGTLGRNRVFQDSIGTMCSVGKGLVMGDILGNMTDQEIMSSQLFDLTKKLLWLCIILTTPMRRDTLRRVLKKAMTGPAPSNSPSVLKPVIVKLIAYSPVHYLETLMDKVDNARGDADPITEGELVAIFALLEMQQYDSVMSQ